MCLTKFGNQDGALGFYQLIRDGYQESLKDAAFCIPRVVSVGRKAS